MTTRTICISLRRARFGRGGRTSRAPAAICSKRRRPRSAPGAGGPRRCGRSRPTTWRTTIVPIAASAPKPIGSIAAIELVLRRRAGARRRSSAGYGLARRGVAQAARGRRTAPDVRRRGEPRLSPLSPSAEDGGFRRWLLLTRKPATVEAFREAWFVQPRRAGRTACRCCRATCRTSSPRATTRTGAPGLVRCAADRWRPRRGLLRSTRKPMTASYASDARLPLKDDGAQAQPPASARS